MSSEHSDLLARASRTLIDETSPGFKDALELADAFDSVAAGDVSHLTKLVNANPRATRNDGYFPSFLVERWDSEPKELSCRMIAACLRSSDTIPAESCLRTAQYGGIVEQSSNALHDPTSWRFLCAISADLAVCPVGLATYGSLVNAAKCLHDGVKYASVFGPRDQFNSHLDLFYVSTDALEEDQKGSHLEACARRLLRYGCIPEGATQAWCAGLPHGVFDEIIGSSTAKSVLEHLEIAPDTPLVDLLASVSRLTK
jgi:hypothetical protein